MCFNSVHAYTPNDEDVIFQQGGVCDNVLF